MADKPNVSRADAENVVKRIQDLREQLNPAEQLVLDNVVAVFEQHVSGPKAQELLKGFPDAPELLEEVSGFTARRLAAPTEPDAITPTWTLTTTVTVAASHPWITCMAAAPSRG